MKLTNLFNDSDDSRAVSPVIGVILMVAITVILAAVIGTFVLGLGDQVESAPQASFNFDLNEDTNEVEITHRGGDTIDISEIEVRVAGSQTDLLESSEGTAFSSDSKFRAGNTGYVDVEGDSGSTVDVVYIAGGSENIIASYEIPSDASL